MALWPSGDLLEGRPYQFAYRNDGLISINVGEFIEWIEIDGSLWLSYSTKGKRGRKQNWLLDSDEIIAVKELA